MLTFDNKSIKAIFNEEVKNYFYKNRELYDPFPDIELQGKSKLTHTFDYLMNTANRPKKLVHLINYLDQAQLERTLLSWQDTAEQRKEKYDENLSMVALINDSEREISN